MVLADPDQWRFVGLAAGVLGGALAVHATVQLRLLRRRITRGMGTAVFDPASGLFAADIRERCITAEAGRAARLGRPLDVWIGTTRSADDLVMAARQLAFDLPGGAVAVRMGDDQLCVMSCTGAGPEDVADGLVSWTTQQFTITGDFAADQVAQIVEERALAGRGGGRA